MTKIKEFKEIRQKQKESEELESSLISRQTSVTQEKEELQNYLSELKEQRPQMLADQEDITELTQDIKNTQEDIELKNDELLGIKNKLEALKLENKELICDVNDAFQACVEDLRPKMIAKYNKKAKEYVDILMDYITFESTARNYNRSYTTPCIANNIQEIPKAGDYNNPLFESYSMFSKRQEHRPAFLKKYKLPDYSYQVES